MRHTFFLWSLTIAALIMANSLVVHAQPAKKKTSPRDEFLERFRDLTPVERMKVVGKVMRKGDFAPAERGIVADVVIERASLEAAKKSDIICRVAPPKQAGPASVPIVVIKWVVEDGTAVKKGDKLIEFDPEPYKRDLERQKRLVDAANEGLRKVDAQLARVERDIAIDVKLADIEVKLAELALKQYKGDDASQKQILALQVDRASLLAMRVKLQAEVKLEQAQAERDAKKSHHERELASLREIEAVMSKTIIHAPHDGIAVYYFPEQGRRSSPSPLVAVGEPVRDGQRLMSVCDLSKMIAVAKIHESSIFKVRVDQTATVRVDAFPNRLYKGKIKFISTLADQAAFFNSDVKVYQVHVAIDDDSKALRPGMSAETTINIAERKNCLRLPIESMLTRNNDKYCYVQVDKELQMRKLTVGLRDSAFFEIIDGLKEGDVVLRYPYLVAIRLEELQKKGP